MSRIVRNWKEIRVDALPIASHRYRFDGTVDAEGNRLGDIDLAVGYRARRACIPYKEGEVVYVEQGTSAYRALIYIVGTGRDRYGDIREWYRVQPETANGIFSKVWKHIHPGFIQRGYQNAGLAPEMPK